jgi:para-nitrobenzyl esterase
MRKVLSVLGALVLAVSVIPGWSAAQEPMLATTENGPVRGTADGDLLSFKGIPFAQPPVGALRWRAPQPASSWDGVLEASTQRPDCVQISTRPLAAGVSEDCLYLNVTRPAAAGGPLPVMVWIYGGALLRGGASEYPPDALARQGIMVVTFNYRVGRFGFFAHPALGDEAPADPRGNYGYLDQIAALQWIQRNIAAFGGDPNNVTVAGESAGGGSILVLMTSPMARGLFQRAIIESPGIPMARNGPVPQSTLSVAESIAVDYAHSLGVDGTDAAALAGLRAVPADTIAEGVTFENAVPYFGGGAPMSGFAQSIIDGRIVVETPEAAFRAGRQAPIPVLVGANKDDLGPNVAMSKDAVFAAFGPLAGQARALYDPNGTADLASLSALAYGEGAMAEPTRNLADIVTNAGQPAYYYRFSYASGRPADHGAEIVYAFNVVRLALGERASEADLDMARTMSAYWVNFVKAGDPNGAGLPQWPRHDPSVDAIINFTNDGVIVGPDPVKARLDLWRAVWEGR